MRQNALQRQDAPALHHVAGERMTQDVGHLPWSMQADALIGFTERRLAGAE